VVLYVLNNRLRVLRILSWLYSGMSSLTADGANLNNEEEPPALTD
jgi:hypothetical protein